MKSMSLRGAENLRKSGCEQVQQQGSLEPDLLNDLVGAFVEAACCWRELARCWRSLPDAGRTADKAPLVMHRLGRK
jgi:hypothetical protein